MTREEAIAIIENEKECVNRANKNDYCNRDCYNCELVKTDTEILTAFDMAIKALKQESKTGHWIYTLEDWNKWECSECGFTKRTDVHIRIGYKYCPNCGCCMEKRGKR